MTAGRRSVNPAARTATARGAVQDGDRAQRALRDGSVDDALGAIVSRIADGIVIVDSDGITRFVNPAAEEIFGRGADELIGHEFGLPLVSGDTADFEILNPRMGPIQAELRVSDIEWDGREARLAAIRDITERVRAQRREQQLVREQTLRAAAEEGERRARFLGEAASILSASLNYRTELKSLAELAVPFLADWCIIDLIEPDGTLKRVAVATASARGAGLVPLIERATPAADADSGAARALRTGEPQLSLSVEAPAMSGILGLAEQRLAEAGFGCCMVLPLTVRDRRLGMITLCDAESSRIFDDDDLELAGEVARRAAVAVDNGTLFTAAQQANQAKADFLAVMSHELRTPLNAVIGYSDLLMMGVPDEVPAAAAEHVRRIRSSARHLLSLIEQILTFSRVEAGREEVQTQQIDVGDVVHEVSSIIEPLSHEKSLEFSVRSDGRGLRMTTDPQKLRQILLNLLSNAVKFTDDGSITLSVEEADQDVAFHVHDTGRGVEPEDIPRIFDPFWQVEQSKTRRAEGTGLGLSVARRLAHLLGGDIFVHSIPGDGSTFTLRLPAKP